jgi:hypothetical protein
MPIRLKVMRSAFITLAAVMALAGCGGGGNESASSTSSTASNTAKTNWTRFGYDYCRDAIVANGGVSSRSSNFPGDAVKTAVFGMGASVADEKQVITGCNRAYREAVRILEGREIDDWYGDGYEDCRGDLENGGGFYNPTRKNFAEAARDNGAIGDEVEQYADGCEAAHGEFVASEPQPETAEAPDDYMIEVKDGYVERIGPLTTSPSGWEQGDTPTLKKAIAVFGRAKLIARKDYGECNFEWSALGLSASFANFAGDQPGCDPRAESLQCARLTGSEWSTTEGLAIGDTLGKLKSLYPSTSRQNFACLGEGGGWSLSQPVEGIDGPYSTLVAQIKDGRIAGFSVSIGAAGE